MRAKPIVLLVAAALLTFGGRIFIEPDQLGPCGIWPATPTAGMPGVWTCGPIGVSIR